MEINRRLANAIKNTYPTNLLSSFYSYILYISSSLIVSPTLRKKRKIRKARRRFRQLDSETEESSFVSRRKARETQRAFLFKMHELSTFSFDRNRKKKEHRTPILDRGYPSPRNGYTDPVLFPGPTIDRLRTIMFYNIAARASDGSG